MQIRPEQLPNHLGKQLLPLYLVSGEDPLLMQESCDAIRAAARQGGCGDREILDASIKGFSWDEISASAASMSLFAERKLIELRIPNGKPGAEGSKALCEYIERASGEDILLIVAGKIDKQSTRSKWFKAIDGAGGVVQIWPVKIHELPRWIDQRVQGAGMRITRDALQLLCDRVEGNLLSAVQEVEKLKLLATDGEITADTVTGSVANNARYDLFAMADTAVQGKTSHALKMLHGLRGEGAEPAVILWALAREIRTLYAISADCQRGQNINQAMTARGVWQSKQAQVKAALSRHSSESLGQLMQQAQATDGSIKGFGDGTPWNRLDALVTALGQSGDLGALAS